MDNRTGSLIVLACGIVFSFGALVFRATDDIGPWQYLTFRGAGAALVVVPLFLYQNRGRLNRVAADLEPNQVLAGLLLAGMMASFIVALTYTDTAFILFFQSAAPITAALFSWILLRERMSREALIATAGTMTGVGVMVAGGLDAGLGWPILIVIAIPTMFGLYVTLLRTAGDIDPLVPVMVGGVAIALIGLAASLATDGFPHSTRDALLGLFAGAALVGAPLPFFNRAQRAVPAPEAALLLMSEIIFAPIWVWLVYDEKPTTATLLGGLVILVSVTWLTMQAVGPSPRVRTSRG